MSFFDDLPAPEPVEPTRYVEPAWRRIPNESVPAPLPLSQVVHRSQEAALVIKGLSVYPTGFTFMLVATRHPEAKPGDVAMHEVLHGGRSGSSGAHLRIGLLHEDGTRATYPERDPHQHGPPAASITSRGGGGSNDSSNAEFFAWPIPGAGDLTIVFRWTAEGLDETRIVIDGEQLRAAAATSQANEIWPGAKAREPELGSKGWSAYV